MVSLSQNLQQVLYFSYYHNRSADLVTEYTSTSRTRVTLQKIPSTHQEPAPLIDLHRIILSLLLSLLFISTSCHTFPHGRHVYMRHLVAISPPLRLVYVHRSSGCSTGALGSIFVVSLTWWTLICEGHGPVPTGGFLGFGIDCWSRVSQVWWPLILVGGARRKGNERTKRSFWHAVYSPVLRPRFELVDLIQKTDFLRKRKHV